MNNYLKKYIISFKFLKNLTSHYTVYYVADHDLLYIAACAICSYPCRNKGFIYQYIQVVDQELEGHLDIKEEIDNNNGISKKSVTGGICQDFFEFCEVGQQ